MKKLNLILSSMVLLLLTACNKDDNEIEISDAGGGDVVMSVLMPNTDGMSGSAYMQMINGIGAASYNNSAAIPGYYGFAPVVIGNNVYCMPSTEGNVVKKYSVSNGTMGLQWELTVPDNSIASSIVEKGDFAYIGMVGSGIVKVINHQSGTSVADIDLTSYSYGDNNPDISTMIVRDDYLYVTLLQAATYNHFPYQDRKMVDVVIIDTKDNSVLKHISKEMGGMSSPCKTTDFRSIFMDENKNIYITCNGSFGLYADHKSGFVRINAGETEFDDSYSFTLSDKAIENDGNPMSYFDVVQYVGNGIVYALVHVPAYSTTTPNMMTDRTEMAVKIDLNAQTISSMGLPRGNCFSLAVGLYDKTVLFGLVTDSDCGFYTYNLQTEQTSNQAVIKTTGYPYLFKHLGEIY